MATLLLSSIGTAVGGPIGGLIGAVAGRTFDTQVLGLGSRRVEGARQENLEVQSGSYGGTIPLVFGTGRYAGNVIWSTGLLEAREEETQGGKGGPSVTTVRYSYSASFAVSLCQGPIQSIGRIWADGKLIRSAGDALSVGGTLRVYLGDEDQLPDPLLEGEIGLEATPGFRGIAYAVFEAMPLAEFGNRIPNLSFEVVEAQTATIGAIAQALLEGAQLPVVNTLGGAEAIGGFQVSGSQSYRDALGVVSDLFELTVVAGVDGLDLRPRQTQTQAVIGFDALGARPDADEPLARIDMDFDHALDLPSQVSVTFSDPATDYQKGVQTALKLKSGGEGTLSVNSAMTLTASDARALAVKTLSKLWDERLVVTVQAGLEASPLEPGDIVSVATSADRDEAFEVTQISHGAMITSITARSLSEDVRPAQVGVPGYSGETQYQQSITPPSIETTVFELPATPQFGADLSVHAAVARTGGRLNSAGLYISRDGGVNFDLAAQIPTSAVTGVCLNGLPDGNAALFDNASVLEVQLDHVDMALATRPQLAILNGANLALVGSELLQFQTAHLQEDGTYRLSGLLRARGGTNHRQMGEAAGQPFILLATGDIATQALSLNDLGTSALYKVVPSGTAIADAQTQNVVFQGAALQPLSPVFLKAQADASGGAAVSWVRRSRTGFGWTDGADAPIGEDSLAFRVTYTVGETTLSRDITDLQNDTLSAAEISSSFGMGPHEISISVAQLSSAVGSGAAATLSLAVA